MSIHDTKRPENVRIVMLKGQKGEKGDTVSADWGTIGGDIDDQIDLKQKLFAKADAEHSHTIGDVQGLETALDAKANESDVETALAGKADTTHSHAISDVTGLQTALDGKAPSSHSHAISDVTGLQTALDGKADDLDITTLNNAIAGMKLTKIWENPSPTVSFSSQSFILEPYNGTCEYVLEFRYDNPTQGSSSYTTEFKHFKLCNPSSGWNRLEFMNFRHISQNVAFFIKSRELELRVQDNNVYVHIGDCYQIGVDPNSTITMSTTNEHLIPIAIYKVGDIYNS